MLSDSEIQALIEDVKPFSSKVLKEIQLKNHSFMINSVMKNREQQIKSRGAALLDGTGRKQNLLTLMTDKSHAIDLRLSAFICGLKFDNTKQPDFTNTDLFSFYSGKLISYECEELRT